MNLKPIKTAHLDKLADYTRKLYCEPELRKLFFELTLQCNERCFHCGSSCTAQRGDELAREEWLRIIDEVKADFDITRMQLCVTGGEPLLNRDIFDIMGYAHEQGFNLQAVTTAPWPASKTSSMSVRSAMCR